jgi:FkbM family methyltransferase
MNKELLRFTLAKILSNIEGIRPRIIRFFYNNLSRQIKGFDISLPYLEKTRILVNTKDIIGWNIAFFGQYERNTNKLLRLLCKTDHVIIEAGANIGSETLLLSKLAYQGRVIAVDPSPWSNRYLNFNVRANSCTNVEILNMALGAEQSLINIHLLPDDFPNQGMSSIIPHSQANRTIEVQQSTLDKEFDTLKMDRLDLIKMDVQGAEFSILKGAEKTIAKYRPTIFLEASPEHSDLYEVYEFLLKYDYQVLLISKSNLVALTTDNLLKGDWICYPLESRIGELLMESW